MKSKITNSNHQSIGREQQFIFILCFFLWTTPLFAINAPTNTAPANGASNLATSLSLDWSNVATNLGYIYELDTTPNFNSPIYSTGSTSTNASAVALGNLLFGTTYYWRAATIGPVDTSVWSSTWSFSLLDAVTNTDPTNGTSNENTSVTIDWSSMSGNMGYLYELDTTPNFNSPSLVSNPTIINSSQAGLDDLRFGTTYYWHAAIKNAIDTSNWGATWSFSTRDGVLTFSPNNAATSQPTNITFDWSTMTGNTGYLYEIDTTPNFNSPILFAGTTAPNVSQLTRSDLFFGTTYYWRVAVKNNVDTSMWSTIWSFTTTDGPINLSPSDGMTAVSINPLLEWSTSDGNTGYWYEIDTTISFNSPLLQTGTTAVNVSQDSVMGLLYGTTYYWRVAITNTFDTSLWSAPTQFTTAFQLSSPLLVSPPNLSVGIPIVSVSLTWDSISTVTNYDVAYSLDSTFTNNTILLNSTVPNISISSLMNDTIYYWRVRASNSMGGSPWSETWSFRTETFTSTQVTPAVTSFQIYPNPVKDLLSIRLLAEETATLQILTVSGQLLEEKIVEQQNSQYSTAHLAQGLYFVKVKTKNKVEILSFVKE